MSSPNIHHSNRIGNKAWTQELSWSGQKNFKAEADHAWVYGDGSNTKEGGQARTASASKGEGSLTFLQVYEAGHMVRIFLIAGD